jgi:hypothetical protein
MNYCPQCSQSANVRRLTWRTFLLDFLRTLTHAEKSIAGTTWNLIKNPGKVMDEYCKGKRKKYQGPVGFYLLWVTASILLHRLVISIVGFHPVYLKGLTFSNPESIRAFVVHGEWIYLICFPLSAAIFYWILAWPLYS